MPSQFLKFALEWNYSIFLLWPVDIEELEKFGPNDLKIELLLPLSNDLSHGFGNLSAEERSTAWVPEYQKAHVAGANRVNPFRSKRIWEES